MISPFCSGIVACPHPARFSDEECSATAAAALGRGFHVPSVALAMAMILRFVVSEEIPRPVVEWNEHILRERTHGTVLWPGVVRDRAGIKAATDVVSDLQEQLSSVDISLPWARVRRLLYKVPLDELQVFWAWAVEQGRDGYVLEPDWAAQYRSPAS